MPEYDINFSPSSSSEGGSFKLLELPKYLCNLIEDAIKSAEPLRQVTVCNCSSFRTHNVLLPSLKVKGQANEDAVLCTDDKTFIMRSVVLSNSVLVITSPPDAYSADFLNDRVIIRDQVNEIMELTPSVPKFHKLSSLLRGREYDEGQEDEDDNSGVRLVVLYRCKRAGKTVIQRRLTYEDARAEIQASDSELDLALKDRHVLNINGERIPHLLVPFSLFRNSGQLRPIAPSYLSLLLELVLNLLVSLSLPHDNASVEELSSTLANEHEVPRGVSTQVMSWFGIIREGKWSMDVNAVLKEMGLSILRHHKVKLTGLSSVILSHLLS